MMNRVISRIVVGLLGVASLVTSSLAQSALASAPGWQFPEKVVAGTPFAVPTAGSGSATLYVVGPGDALRKNVQLGENIVFGPEELRNAGRYVVLFIAGASTRSAQFDVLPASQVGNLTFSAGPSRLPVNQTDGLSGVVYLLDAFNNLIVQPQPVGFELSDSTGRPQSRTATTRNGVAWIRLNSAVKAGPAQFEASAGNVREKRIVLQVAGDPCRVRMTAHGNNDKIVLETEQIRDCNGNSVPDGTILTFTEVYAGHQSTVDVPLKRGVARTELPAHRGAVISVASGVVMGNEIYWSGGPSQDDGGGQKQ